MKKRTNLLMITIVALFSIQVNSVFGQSTVIGNNLSGPSPEEPNEFLGSENDYDVILKAKDTERMRINRNTGNVGIGTVWTPKARLEINATSGSELRFTSTSSASGVFARSSNPGDGLLTLDEQGYVVYVPHFIYTAYDATNGNRFGIDGSPTSRTKLRVHSYDQETGIDVWATKQYVVGLQANYGVRAFATGSGSANYGGHFSAAGISGTAEHIHNIGLSGTARSNDKCWGGWFRVQGETGEGNEPTHAVGVQAEARQGTVHNVGGAFTAPTEWGSASDDYGIVATGGDGAALFFGNSYTVFGNHIGSDLMLKDSIEDVGGALELLDQLQPKTFVYKTENYPIAPRGRHYGLIAQQVDSIIPGVIDSISIPEIKDSAGTVLIEELDILGLNYVELLPLLVSGVNGLNESKVGVCWPYTESNYIPKWDSVNRTLCHGIIYDDGNNIGVGTITPDAKLEVNTEGTTGAKIVAEGNGNNQKALIANAADGVYLNRGMEASGTSSGSAVAEGISANASGSTGLNRAGYFTAVGSGSSNNYGIYAGSFSGATNYAGYFLGNVYATGTVTWSDAMFKDSVKEVSGALKTLARLQPKSYVFDRNIFKDMPFKKGRQYGFIAQQLDSILPELVETVHNPAFKDSVLGIDIDEFDFLGINYNGLIPLLISGINDLSAEMEQMKEEKQGVIDSLSAVIDTRLSNIEEALNDCCRSDDEVGYRQSAPEDDDEGEEQVKQISVELNSVQAVVLEQNVPNPFAEQTTIFYFVPENAGSAKMMFYDAQGRNIKTVDVQKGQSVMKVFGNDLSTGTYSYALVVDSKVMEVKKMVKIK